MAEQPAAVVFIVARGGARTREATSSEPSLCVCTPAGDNGSGVPCKALHGLHALGGDICRVEETKVRKPVPTWLLGALLVAERLYRLLRNIDVAVFVLGGENLEFLVEAVKACCLGSCVYALRAFLCAEMALDFRAS